jgi:PAS domain S-box-containing protein
VAASTEKYLNRILHVDDDLCLLEVSKQILSMENNFDIDNATSVDEALKKMKNESYDVVVSDYEMPQKNGLEFLKELREQNNQIPFILFTGKGREDVAVKALNLGADRYINKNGSTETVYCELADAIKKTVERKKSRELLAKSESKYHALVENSLQGISILLAAPLRIVFANGAFGKILGYSSQELMSLSPEGIMSLVYHEDRAIFFKRMENRLRGEPAGACFEFRAVRKDGSIIWLSSLANRVDYDGQRAVQGMFLDINESKKAMEILSESEQRYRELANFLPEIVFETDLTGKITFFSQRAFEITGFTPEELAKGVNMLSFVVPEERERATENIKKSLAREDHDASEYTLFKKDGSTYSALVRTEPIFSENKVQGLRGIVVDITHRKRMEDELKVSEERLRLLFEYAPDAYYLNDLKGNFVDGNKGAEEITGFTRSELIGKSFLSLNLLSRNQILKAAKLLALNVLDKPTGPDEFILNRKDGAQVSVEIRTHPLKIQGRKLVLGIARNITDRKKSEEELKKDRAEMEIVNGKLHVVGGLTRHDVGNKLMVIKSNIYLLKKQIGNNPKLAKYLEDIDSAIRQSDEMFEFSRLYEKIGVEKPSKTDVVESFNQAVALTLNLGAVEIVNNCQGLEVIADSLLKQLFYNFIDNSLKHGEKVTRIRLHYTQDGGGVKLFYEDNGVGVPEVNKPKLFEIGFTTGKGSGLGLYLIKKMMEVYGWTITEEGEPGKGAKFEIKIPVQTY